MKAVPTETDREAARLFEPAPGMRIILSDRLFGGLWARVSVTGERMAGCYEVGVDTWDAWAEEWQRMDAIDTDDPATAGQMLVQVESMRPGQAVSIVDRMRSLPGEDERRFAVLVEHDGAQTVATGPTRGAALVAARRACG